MRHSTSPPALTISQPIWRQVHRRVQVVWAGRGDRKARTVVLHEARQERIARLHTVDASQPQFLIGLAASGSSARHGRWPGQNLHRGSRCLARKVLAQLGHALTAFGILLRHPKH